MPVEIGTPLGAANGTTIVEVDPISRIEGHLGVKLSAVRRSDSSTEADVHGNLWRGFENFLLGREVNDAITFTQRICGVCPVPHGMTSTYAADAVLGYSQNHITFADERRLRRAGQGGLHPQHRARLRVPHVEHHALLSPGCAELRSGPARFRRGPRTSTNSYYAAALGNVGTQAPSRPTPPASPTMCGRRSSAATCSALRIRRLTFEAGALFAGRMPMTSCLRGAVASRSTSTEVLTDRCDKFRSDHGRDRHASSSRSTCRSS